MSKEEEEVEIRSTHIEKIKEDTKSDELIGKPLQIVDIVDHKFVLNQENLESILNHPKSDSKKVKSQQFYQLFFKIELFQLNI
jgi:hypothetical protein